MRHRMRRRGAALLETAFTLPIFLVLVLGTVDVGLGVFRLHTINGAARSGARMAIVHGSEAARLGRWGPEPIDVPLSDQSVPIAAALRPLLVASDPNTSHVLVEWPDQGSDTPDAPGKEVRVTVTSPYRPIVTAFLPSRTLTIRSTSTMTIAH